MATNQSMHVLKPNLSQLLMRTFEQLEDPKYATVPKTHWDELRPSILSHYYDKLDEEHELKSEGDLCKEADKNVQQECFSKSSMGTHKCASRSSKPLSFRAINWKIQPLWRYCASAVHLNNEQKDARRVSRAETKTVSSASQEKIHEIKFYADQQKKWRSQSFEELKKKSQQSFSKQPQQYSTAAFEVLPPLFEHHTHRLLYQNSYLLDGVKYDYVSKKSQEQRAKLYLNYMRFLKSVNKPIRPSDCDVVFGDAKIVLNPSPHWEGRRIDWLLNLERKQEMRKLQILEQEKQLMEKRKAIELARIEAKRTQKALNKNAKIKSKMHKDETKPPTTATVHACENCQSEKRKCFFLKKFRKPANCRKIPQVELIPTL